MIHTKFNLEPYLLVDYAKQAPTYSINLHRVARVWAEKHITKEEGELQEARNIAEAIRLMVMKTKYEIKYTRTQVIYSYIGNLGFCVRLIIACGDYSKFLGLKEYVSHLRTQRPFNDYIAFVDIDEFSNIISLAIKA